MNKQTSSLGSDAFVLMATCAVLAIAAEYVRGRPNIFGPPAPTKPYPTLDAFFPFYMAEHSEPLTRTLHYIGTTLLAIFLVASPGLIVALGVAAFAGHSVVFPLTRHLPNGLIEFASMLAFYVILGRRLTGSWKRTLLPPVLAYTCAWVGHFFIEHNRPATFM